MSRLPIYNVTDSDIKIYEQIKNHKDSGIVCVLSYHYTTGPGWCIENSTNETLIGENIILNVRFDPRMLKENKDFSMDYRGRLVVDVKQIKEIRYDNEVVKVLFPKNIVIIYDTEKSSYNIYDFTLAGILKSIISVFYDKYEMSI